LLPKHVWAIRVRLALSGNLRDLALFNLAIDSKLRGCDLVRLKVSDLIVGDVVRERVTITQSKTGHPVQFEVGDLARKAISAWCARLEMTGSPFLFPSRFHGVPHISTRQYARMVQQ
jgi:integrase